MRKTRVIVALLLGEGGLVKTTRFKNPKYIGDPINAVRIFNEKEVDELVFLDIGASRSGRCPNFDLLSDIAGEAFMPMGYGGGIATLRDARRIFSIGYEKVIINSAAAENVRLITEVSEIFGSQGVVASIDVRKNMWGKYEVWTHGGTRRLAKGLDEYLHSLEVAGAGEIILNAIDRDGTMSGYDLSLLARASALTSVPLVALGGARTVADFGAATGEGGASAVAAGAMFVFVGPHRAVLINYPSSESLAAELQ